MQYSSFVLLFLKSYCHIWLLCLEPSWIVMKMLLWWELLLLQHIKKRWYLTNNTRLPPSFFIILFVLHNVTCCIDGSSLKCCQLPGPCMSVSSVEGAVSTQQTLSINIAPSGPIRHAEIFLHQQIKVNSINPPVKINFSDWHQLPTGEENVTAMSVTGGYLCQKMKGLKLNKLFPQPAAEEAGGALWILWWTLKHSFPLTSDRQHLTTRVQPGLGAGASSPSCLYFTQNIFPSSGQPEPITSQPHASFKCH